MNKNSKLLFSLFLLFLIPSITFSQTKKDLENKKSMLQKEIKLTNKLLEETKKSKKLSLNQLVTLNQKISIREELISTINRQISSINRNIADNTTVISNLEKELEQLKKEYAKMIYYAFKNQDSYGKMMFLFSSKDFNQAYMRLKYLQQYSDYRKSQAEQIKAKQALLNNKIEDLKQKKREQQGLLGEKEGEKNELSKERTEKEQVLSELQDKEKQLKEELKKKQEDANKLQQAITRIIEEEIRKAREAAKKANNSGKETKENKVTSQGLTLTPEAQKLSATFETNKGKLPWPVTEGVVTSTFGEHEHPVLKGIKVKNNGVDISTRNGSQVRAVFDGEVTGVITIPGAGKAIIVRHGEYLSVYSNLESTLVKTGEKVKTKQSVGVVRSDDDGKAEVHLEIWKGSIMLNPEGWIFKNNP